MLSYERVSSPSLPWATGVLAFTNMLQLPFFIQQHARQTLARLQTYPYLAFTLDGYKNEEGKSHMKPMHARSRFRVYGLSRYNIHWGPFMPTTGHDSRMS